MNADGIRFPVLIACLVVISSFLAFSAFSQDFNQWGRKSIANFFINEGWQQLKATNTVTTIVWEYRGYDTLGEESILFTAAMGVLAMGFGLFSAEKMQNKEPQVKS